MRKSSTDKLDFERSERGMEAERKWNGGGRSQSGRKNSPGKTFCSGYGELSAAGTFWKENNGNNHNNIKHNISFILTKP